MSLDRSLKTTGSLTRHRNVLKRAERIAILEDEDRWNPDQSVFGLPKVAHRKSIAGHKTKKAETTPTEGAGEAPAESAGDTEQSQEKQG